MKGSYVWIPIFLALLILLFINLTIKIPVGGHSAITEIDLPYYRAEIRAEGSGTSVVALNLPEGNYTVITKEGELLPSYYNGTHLLIRASLVEGVNTLLLFRSQSSIGHNESAIFDFSDDFTTNTLESERWKVLASGTSVGVYKGYITLSGGGNRWDKVESRNLEVELPYVVEVNLSCQADFCWICLSDSDAELKDELSWGIPEGVCAGMSTLPPSNPWGGIGIKVIEGKNGSAQVSGYENARSGLEPVSEREYVRMTVLADRDGINLACCGYMVTMRGYEAPRRFKLKLLAARNGTFILDWIRIYRYLEQDAQTEKSRGILSLESAENEIRVLEVVDIPEVVKLKISCEGLKEQSLRPKKGETVNIPLEEGTYECLAYFAAGNTSISDVRRVELVVPSLIEKLLPTLIALVVVLIASLGYLLYLKMSRYRQSKELEKILE